MTTLTSQTNQAEASRPAALDTSGSATAGRDGSKRRGRRGQRSRGPNAARRRAIRGRLAARDGACCFYCGHRFAVLAEATIDHLIPHSQVPGWKLANLVLACGPCNHAKGDRLPQEFLRPSAFAPGLIPVRAGHVRALMRAVRTLAAVFVRTACRTARVRPVSGRYERSDRTRTSAHGQTRVSGDERSQTGRAAPICPRVRIAGDVRRHRPRARADARTVRPGGASSPGSLNASVPRLNAAPACGPPRTARTDARTNAADYAEVPAGVCGWLERRHAA